MKGNDLNDLNSMCIYSSKYIITFKGKPVRNTDKGNINILRTKKKRTNVYSIY